MKIETLHKEWNKEFDIREKENGYMQYLGNKDDTEKMNWIEGNRLWGEALCPDEVQVDIIREYTSEGNLIETYKFRNTSCFPVFLKKTDVGIYTTFNDNYQEAGRIWG